MVDNLFIMLYSSTSLLLQYQCQDHIGLIGRLPLTPKGSSSPCQLNGQTEWHARAEPQTTCNDLDSVQWSEANFPGPRVGQHRVCHCRCLDPAVRHQLVKCCVVSLPGWLMQEATQERTVYLGSGRGAVRPGKGCARALYYLAPGVPVVGNTNEAREGGKLPSLC